MSDHTEVREHRQSVVPVQPSSLRVGPFSQKSWILAGSYNRTLGLWEIALWCLLYAIVVAGLLYHFGGPRLSDDSYQYLSEAENIDNGYGFKTSVVHFDTERLSGKLPAPLTTFPPGYPLAIAALAETTIRRETAGLILSAASFIFLVPLIISASGLLQLSAIATRIALLALLGNAVASVHAVSVATDSLFTAFSIGALVCFLRYERGKGREISATLGGSVLIACAFSVRYAGLFLFAAVGMYLVWQAIVYLDRWSAMAAACLALPAGLIGFLLVRNAILTGSWKGGNTKLVTHALPEVLKQFGASTFHLFFGEVPARLGPMQVTFGVCFVILLVTAGWAIGITGIRSAIGSLFSRGKLLVVYVAVYCASMIYTSMSSVIANQSRSFYPLMPVYLLLIGLILARVQSLLSVRSARLICTACAVLTVGSYWGINLEATMAQPPGSPHQAVEARFAMPDQTGRSLLSWFQENVPPDAVLAASEGQATEYALKRKTVSLVSSQYSDQPWDETAVRALMQRYEAEYLILYPGIDPTIEPVQRESPFLSALIAGRRLDWLQLAASNNEVMIFRRTATGESPKATRTVGLPEAVQTNGATSRPRSRSTLPD
jgi:hypothetical protein